MGVQLHSTSKIDIDSFQFRRVTGTHWSLSACVPCQIDSNYWSSLIETLSLRNSCAGASHLRDTESNTVGCLSCLSSSVVFLDIYLNFLRSRFWFGQKFRYRILKFWPNKSKWSLNTCGKFGVLIFKKVLWAFLIVIRCYPKFNISSHYHLAKTQSLSKYIQETMFLNNNKTSITPSCYGNRCPY